MHTHTRSHTQELREDAFSKVERMFMVGLRANNPAVHRDFFSMYDSHVPLALYDRLQFVIFSHDWEAMATQFWLKHALVGVMIHSCVWVT